MFKSRSNVIFNGIDLAERFNRNREFLVIKSVRGREYIPTSREVIQVPNKPGGYSKPLRIHPRTIEIEYYIKANSLTDLRKRIEEFNRIIFDKEQTTIQFADEIDRIYYGNVDNVTQTDEILKVHQGKLTVICMDPFKYAVTPKMVNGLIVHNHGTTDTPFKLKMTATAPATYLSISNGEKSLGIGKPASNRFVEELKFHDSIDSLNGWTPIPTLLTDYLEVGAITVINNSGYYGNGFELRNVTTEGAGWRGRSIVKSVGTTKDYRVEGIFEVVKILGEWGTVRQYVLLVDALGKEIGRMGVSFDGRGSRFEVRLGNEANNYVMIDSLAQVFTFEEGVFCKIILSKKGNVYRTSVIRVDKQSGVEIKEELTAFYTDLLNIYSSNGMSAVAYHASQQKHQLQRLYDIKIYEYVDENTLNPNVVTVGDVIEIDTDAQLIFINGQIRKQYKSIESDYFNLRPGKNPLFVYPIVTENHEITLRERYL